MEESYVSFEEDYDRKVTVKYDRKDVMHPKFLDCLVKAVAEVNGVGLAVEVLKIDENKWCVVLCMQTNVFE